MQRFKKIVSLLFVLLLVTAVIRPHSLNAATITDVEENSKTGYGAMVYDGAGLFRNSEVDDLLDEAYKLTEYSDVFVVTVAKGENPHGSTESATKKYGDDLYLKYSNQDSCIMFIIDMHTRYIYVYRYGKAEKTLTAGKCDSITDNLYDYASDGEYYLCSSKAL